jgi:hypothetical protein
MWGDQDVLEGDLIDIASVAIMRLVEVSDARMSQYVFVRVPGRLVVARYGKGKGERFVVWWGFCNQSR